MANYVYEYKDALYFNLTNRCSNKCSFCVRNHDTDLKEKELWFNKSPNFDDVISQIPEDISKYSEFVFCGYGEPTYEIDLIREISAYLKQFNKPIRINTNGHGNLINNRSIIEDLKNVDIISISLNAPNRTSYQNLCHSIYFNGFEAMIDFAKQCKESGKEVIFTVVDVISEEEIEECKILAEKLGITLRVRQYY